MRLVLLLFLLTGVGFADDWARHMSPRMREKFAPLLRPDWDPKRVDLTEKEKKELRELFQPLVEQVRRRPVLLNPETPGQEAPQPPAKPTLE